MKTNSSATALRFTHRNFLPVILSLLMALGMLFISRFMLVKADNPPLSVEILTAYNLVVDSNVSSPSTYGPSAATVGVKFCNTSGSDLHNVWAYIGDYTGSGNLGGTPGDYPDRWVTNLDYSWQSSDFTYSFTHIGSDEDASRFITDTMPAGMCSVQYWHFDYPKCENNDPVPCDGGMDPVWGASSDPSDDLWLEFDAWAVSDETTTSATRKLTMRNEISAMANKIEPNPDGAWFNTESNTVDVGDVITSNGVNYTFGNVNKGFDNDGDGLFDYNAWVQPVGNADFDPSCFRLIRTSGVLTVTRGGGNPPMIMNFTDQLYFENLPSDNTNVTGRLYYTFEALNGVCTASLSPYQEAASGSDNEKFNADYGSGIPPLVSLKPEVTLDKYSLTDPVSLNTIYTYRIPFQNNGDIDFGLTLSTGGVNMPLVIKDMVPEGLEYVSGSATSNASVTILYSTDGGNTWSSSDPGTMLSHAPNNVYLQWWLDAPLPAHTLDKYAEFQARAPSDYSGSSFVENCAEANVGGGDPFAEACDITMIDGDYSIGDLVWRDLDSDGSYEPSGGDNGPETGIDGVDVYLYWDKNESGTLDDGDILIDSTTTSGGGAYIFDNLPNGNYLVKVDSQSINIPNGFSETTGVVSYVVLSGADYDEADFGFGPALSLDKNLISSNPAYEGEQVTFTIDLNNERPGSGEAPYCTYTIWAELDDPEHSGTGTPKYWYNPDNAMGGVNEPDGAYAYINFLAGADNRIAGSQFSNLGDGRITKVEALYRFYLTAHLVNDTATLYIWDDGPATPIEYSKVLTRDEVDTFYSGTGEFGFLEWDATSVRTWNWADFASNIAVGFENNKVSNADTSEIRMDSLGFRVTTNQLCGSLADIIDPLPLDDIYDADRLQYVSAIPAATSVTTGGNSPYANTGTIHWANFGPLYAGQTKQITVTFKALEPNPKNQSTTITNTASVTQAKFATGRNANDASDDVPVTINPTGTIGDLVWIDLNNNSSFDSGEGLAGVTVELRDGTCTPSSTCLTAVTSASGNYLFEAVRNGTYTVVVNTTTLPGGAAGFTNFQDKDGDNDHDSGNFTINNTDGDGGNDDVLDADFGYRSTARIVGSIWNDRNHNHSNTRDSGEEGLSNVLVYVQITDCDAPPFQGGTADDCPHAYTNANGNYTILGTTNYPLSTGSTYTVIAYTSSLPGGASGWTQSHENPSSGPLDSTISVTIPVGGIGRADYSYYRSGNAAIGDTVYRDWDGNGFQATSEPGISGVTVKLYEDSDGDGLVDPEDALIATTETIASGVYSFSGLPDGTYTVIVDTTDPQYPNDWPQTGDPDSVIDNKGAKIVISGGVVTSIGGQACTSCNNNVDFGYQPIGTGSIGDLVWRDDDGDGVQDSGEPGLPNISVSLYYDANNDGLVDSGDPLVGMVSTDAKGNYLFDRLPAGNYLVDVNELDPQLPVDGNSKRYVLSTDDLQPVNGLDNDPLKVALADGQNYTEADFGFRPGGLIGDFIWRDNDGDGTYDQFSETGISGVTVNLYVDVNGNGLYDVGTDYQAYYDVNGNGTYDAGADTLYTATTNASGGYEFTSLPAGKYVVVVTPPANHTLTGDPDAYSTDPFNYPHPPCNPADTTHYKCCDSQSGVTLYPGQVDRSHDFGYQPPNAVGDHIWLDENKDGIQDPGEPGIAGVTVYLSNGICTYPGGASPCPTAVTDSDGYYSIGGMANGTYTVIVDTATLPADLVQTGDPDQPGIPCTTCNNQSPVTLAGTRDMTKDFGYYYNGTNTIGGTLFLDVDNDGGPYQSGDVVLKGITVYLWTDCGLDLLCGNADDARRLIASTQTAADGSYNFPNLPSGNYEIVIDSNSPSISGLTTNYEPDEFGDNGLCSTGSFTNCDNRTNVNTGDSDATDQDWGFYAEMDCGDLPASYNKTLLSDEGPCHIRGDIQMGANWDAEVDGYPDSLAQGDDTHPQGSDNDEDGISFPDLSNWTAGDTGTIRITSITGDNAYLVGWFDWNRDNDFFDADTGKWDAGEYVYFGNIPAGSSNIDKSVPIPSSAVLPNIINMRFRLYEGASPPPVISPGGIVMNGEVEDYQEPLGPTAVTMSDYAAYSGIGQITIRWQTALELDALGFNLYRASSPDGQRVQINPELIPSKAFGGLFGATYEFVDSDLPAGETYYYWLEFIDLEGKQVFGPMSATSNYGVYLPLVRH